MAKELSLYRGTLPPTRNKFHLVMGKLVFILFDKNQSDILKGHDTVIREKVVDFLVKAVRALGPDTYNLSVLGMASATGSHDVNMEIAGKRAYNCAMCAIRHFEKLQKTDPTLKGATINPDTTVLGDDLSQLDATILHLKRSQTERQQGIFRSAVFKFIGGRLEDHVNRPPSFVCSGPEAIRRAHELLANTEPEMAPFPSTWGTLTIKQGQVWGATRRLIVSADWQHVTYLEGNTLWSTPTADFAREILLDGIIEGMERAKPMVELSKVVMTFVQGLLVGPLEALGAKLIVLFMWAGAHEDLVKQGYDAAGPAYRGLKYLHDHCPTLWDQLETALKNASEGEFVDALEETVTKPENIAFFLGRVLQGVGGLSHVFYGKVKPSTKMVEVTFGKILFVTVECAALVAALHFPEGLAAITEKNIKELSSRLKQDFASNEKIKMLLNDTEAQKIAGELLGPGVKGEIDKMQKPLRDFQDVLNKFMADMKDLE